MLQGLVNYLPSPLTLQDKMRRPERYGVGSKMYLKLPDANTHSLCTVALGIWNSFGVRLRGSARGMGLFGALRDLGISGLPWV